MKKNEQIINFNPKVSIIIPVYNGSNYLREAIDSALKQTYENIEIIVVNDGSQDDTEEICKSYGKKIKYFNKENGGTSTALNVGIKNMTGEYFSWLSHDDQYYPDKIKRQIEELSKLENKKTIMMSDLDGINSKYQKIYVTNYANHINEYPKRNESYIYPIIYNKTHGCTLLISKVCFKEVGIFDEEQFVAQDFEFFYRVFLKYPHKLISEVLVTARDSDNRQGRRLRSKGDEEYSALYIKIIDELTDKDYSLLSPSKFEFYKDMEAFFKEAGYSHALKYIRKKIIKNLQVSSNDLIGNKFNGHNLHLYLRDKEIDSIQMVLNKQSSDINTVEYNFNKTDSTIEFIQREEFLTTNILHFHLIHNIIDINYLPLITKLKPTVISLHDAFFLGGHCVHHFECTNWLNHCKDCPYLKELFPLEYDKSSLLFEMRKTAIQNSQISVIVASNWMKERVNKSPIWKGKKIYYLPFGLDQTIFKPKSIELAKTELEIPINKFVIMFREDSGSFKGLDIIKKSLKDLKNKNKYVILTVGEKGLLKEIEKEFEIKEFGWIYDDFELVKLYQACDIFLMPSRYESFGMMAIEAMACEKTVLALNTTGSALPEAISSPECGLAVQEEDYSKELQRLINNSKELKDRGKKSFESVKNKHSKEKYVSKMIDIYKEVISEHVTEPGVELTIEQMEKHSLQYFYDQSCISNSEPCSIENSKRNEFNKNRIDKYVGNFKNIIKKIIYTPKEIFRKVVPLKTRQSLKLYIKDPREIYRKVMPLKTRKNLKLYIKNPKEIYRKVIPLKIRQKLKKTKKN